ncbi:MAG: hypothetical protein H8E22_08175 [Candidatus Cloacimonetes bacterium]|nr:hypothetical protein [Candidatus Cloacimonadota bacterium]
MKKNIIISLIIFLLLTACAPKILPIRSNNVKIQENYAVITHKDYNIAIEPSSWNDPPSNLENYFMVFYVILRNKTNQKMHIDKDAFVMIDDKGEQYSIFGPQQIVQIMYGDNQYFDLNYFMNFDDEDHKDLKEEYETRLDGIRNIMMKSFQFDPIRPQAQESGYLFFERLEFKKQALFKIYYNDDVMEFIITK